MELRKESEFIFKKAKDNIDRAENIIREQEKIIKKLEDLLHRSMDTVDKRKPNSQFEKCQILELIRSKCVNLALNTA